MAKSGRLDKDGNFSIEAGKPLHPGVFHLPPDIIENIIREHQKLVRDLCLVYQEELKLVITATRAEIPHCNEDDESSQYDAMAFGSLMLHLRLNGLPAEKKDFPTGLSANDVYQRMKPFQVKSGKHKHHTMCNNWYMDEDIEDQMRCHLLRMPSALSKVHHRHLQRQAKKLGL
ncbi:uncharacterized protein J3D65DRAFT_297288 [Phyllosticta citribraziliensis]|uniref:Uncharacterized protein n=1 Tax=Phyllosticta citribraziliensis TaxID=989973 RepID=A0ABR1LX60_9PEZI